MAVANKTASALFLTNPIQDKIMPLKQSPIPAVAIPSLPCRHTNISSFNVLIIVPEPGWLIFTKKQLINPL